MNKEQFRKSIQDFASNARVSLDNFIAAKKAGIIDFDTNYDDYVADAANSSSTQSDDDFQSELDAGIY